MRAVFGLVSLLVVLAIVGLLASQQLKGSALSALPPGGAASAPEGRPPTAQPATGYSIDLRMRIFLVLDNDCSHQAGRLIDVALDRDSRDHVAEFNLTGLVFANGRCHVLPRL